MRITDLLTSEHVFPSLEAGGKEEAVRLLCEAAAAGDADVSERIFKAVMDRERIMSTGVGKGLGIPHGKVNGLDRSLVLFARLRNPIEFGSIDRMPVSMVFLVVGPDAQSGTHIRLLSRISRLMNNDAFRDRLSRCADAAAILAAFEEEERLHP